MESQSEQKINYMQNIEVEIRSFINEDQYENCLKYFTLNGNHLQDSDQITYYYSGEIDLRLQKSNKGSKLWLKKGKIHDDQREEIEVYFENSSFENCNSILLTLGYEIEIKWFRKRTTFEWDGIKVSIDDTTGYGKIIELEKMSNIFAKDEVLDFLKEKMKELNIEITPKSKFKEQYEYYKKNWKNLV